MNEFVASFRIPLSLKEQIEEDLRIHPVKGCNTVNQYLRTVSIETFCSVSGCLPPTPPRAMKPHKVRVMDEKAWEASYSMALEINSEIQDFDSAYAKFLRDIQGT